MIAMPTKYFLSPREMKKENIRCAGGMKKKGIPVFHIPFENHNEGPP